MHVCLRHGHIQDLDPNLSPAAERQSLKCSGARLCAQMTKPIKCRAWRRDSWIVLLDRLARDKLRKSDRPRCWRKHDVIGQDIQYIIELSSLSHSFGGEGLTFCTDLQRTLLRSCKAVFVTNMSTAAEVFILLRLSLIKKRHYSTLFNGKKSHKLPRQVM